jgi:uncharacterized membrane protein
MATITRYDFITAKSISAGEAIQGKEIRTPVLLLIQRDYPGFTEDSWIALDTLNQYRRLFLAQLVEQEKGEIATIDADVMAAIRDNAILSENIDEVVEGQLTLGDRLADHIATFGGSWTFIITFFSFILIWMAINIWILATKPFDPYPFILLNLILSCLAAIQAPIIMMSQNRQETKDRQRAEHDYRINLKAELEIKLLSEKMDHILVHQNKKLLEIQEVQIDYLEDLLKRMKDLESRTK